MSCLYTEHFFIEKYLIKRYTATDIYVKPATTEFNNYIGQMVNVACDVHEIKLHARFNGNDNSCQHNLLPNPDEKGNNLYFPQFG